MLLGWFRGCNTAHVAFAARMTEHFMREEGLNYREARIKAVNLRNNLLILNKFIVRHTPQSMFDR
jgi:hypothetical protein